MFRIKHVNGFASFEDPNDRIDDRDFGAWDAKGPRMLGKKWRVPTMELDDADLPLPDWSCLMSHIPIISQRALDVWADLLPGCAEALPVRIDRLDVEYFVLNVCSRNALDLSKSRFDMWESEPGSIRWVSRVIFHEDLVGDLMLLRSLPGLYCSAEFAKRGEQAQLLGFACSSQLEVP